MKIAEILLGRRLASTEIQQQLIGPILGVSVFGLDALSSAAYGPEAALAVLIPYGHEGLHYIIPIMMAITILLSIVYVSYRQTISGYPQGGGSYTVAKENLGGLFGLIAAAGLCVDYILNVAVAISAGAGALVSALPVLHRSTLLICLVILAGLTIVNLRGIREAGLVFVIPTWFFILSIASAICFGVYQIVSSGGHPVSVEKPFTPIQFTGAIGIWVVVRSFANGCSAMTGVEAVSNGVTLFKSPGVRNAKTTLSIIIGVLIVFLIGISLLSYYYQIGAMHQWRPGYQSVLSQMFDAVYGRKNLYYVSITSVFLVLILSANTSFAGFPRVCNILARDHYLPEIFTHRGRRLVYSGGIYVLALCSAALLILFEGITDLLIPLFAIGAFIAFTCSQSGMVVHWWKRRVEPGVVRSMLLNLVGAMSTFVALLIVFFSKFTAGAWLTLLIIPVVVWMLRVEKNYNDRIARQVYQREQSDFSTLVKPIIVVPIHTWDRLAENGLRLAMTISDDVRLVQVVIENDEEAGDARSWYDLLARRILKSGRPLPKLIQIKAAYRDFVETILFHVQQIKNETPNKDIAIIIPQLIEPRWYHFIFRNEAMFLESALLWKGGPRVIVISTPWYLTK